MPVEVDVGELGVAQRQGLTQDQIASTDQFFGEAPRQPKDDVAALAEGRNGGETR